jgi:F-type H+-transporting ATPase subunit gamma
MTRRHDLERHRRSLGEIRGIMNSMRTLAYLETRKLGRLIPPQESVVRHIEEVAADFLQFHPHILPAEISAPPVCIVVGSERGFCGDFNRRLVDRLQVAADSGPPPEAQLLLLGRRLHPLLQGSPRVAVELAGASVAEEIPGVLLQVADELASLRQRSGPFVLYGLYHRPEGDGPVAARLLPPFDRLPAPMRRLAHAPLLNVPPERFFVELGDQYLFAALSVMLYLSLMAENHTRVAHLERATDHLEQQWRELGRQSNAMRQEEIIEEIEVILLSAASAGDGECR